MLFSKLLTFLMVLAPALPVLWLLHRSAEHQQRDNSRVRATIQSIESEIDALERTTRAASSGVAAAVFAERPPGPNPSEATAADSPAPVAESEQAEFIALNKSSLKNLELSPFTDGFQLTDEVCAVLGIGPVERAALDRDAAKLISTQQGMDVSRAQPTADHLSAEEGRKTSFKVPAYPEEGRKLAEEFTSAVEGVIGSERAELFLNYASFNDCSPDGYEPFGRTEKTITFVDRLNPDGTRGECKIYLKVVDATLGYTLNISFDNRDDAIPRAWRHLIDNVSPAP